MLFTKKLADFCRKLIIFVGRVDNLCRKIRQFLFRNSTIFTRKFDVFYKKMCQVLQEKLKIFAEKFDGICWKI